MQEEIMDKSIQEDELVKYMSNLPGYLRRTGETHQEKALNYGVLDWSRLEKWKHHRESGTISCENGLEHNGQSNVIHEERRINVEEASSSSSNTGNHIVLLLPRDMPRHSCSRLSTNRRMLNTSRRSCSSLDDRFPNLPCETPRGKITSSISRTVASPPQPRISRSLSLKNDPQIRSSSQDSHRGNRTSPLRRLLEPILNLKSPGNETKTMISTIQKNVSPVLRGLLQITLKNEITLFKFVVDEKSDILATTAKKVDGSFSDWLYTIYSVREMKKKNIPWVNKNKNCDYLYDAVGQMKISCHDEGHMESRESVLYSFEQCPNTQKPTRELAAIVVEIPKRNVGESRTTVIVPRGVHGIPNEGLPSSLIDRWKSGGSCDCGGWDVGCSFRVLADHGLGKRTASLASTRLHLFTQGHKGKRPIFSLVPYKNDIYAVDFSLSLSSLQAFSICMALINNKKWDMPSSQNYTQDGIQRPNPAISQPEAPPKFVPFPPLSPVGRA